MEDDARAVERPLWVRVGLWQVPTRAAALAYFWLCVALTVAGLVAGVLYHPLLFALCGLALSAWWYWAAMSWMDRNGGWPTAQK